MSNKTEKKVWKDHKGESIPDKYVNPYHKKKEKVVGRLVKQAEDLSERLKVFKNNAFNAADELYYEMLRMHHMDEPEGGKGNRTFFNFDKSIKVEISVDDVISFDEQITLAQAKINQFIAMKLKDVDTDITELINRAFTTSKGRLDKARVFSLFSLNVKHHLWTEAMDLIRQSIVTNNTRRYIKVYKRDSEGKYHLINLNFSAV